MYLIVNLQWLTANNLKLFYELLPYHGGIACLSDL